LLLSNAKPLALVAMAFFAATLALASSNAFFFAALELGVEVDLVASFLQSLAWPMSLALSWAFSV